MNVQRLVNNSMSVYIKFSEDFDSHSSYSAIHFFFQSLMHEMYVIHILTHKAHVPANLIRSVSVYSNEYGSLLFSVLYLRTSPKRYCFPTFQTLQSYTCRCTSWMYIYLHLHFVQVSVCLQSYMYIYKPKFCLCSLQSFAHYGTYFKIYLHFVCVSISNYN